MLWDARGKVFYVSNMAGKPLEKDGKGWISLMSEDGKLIAPRWVEGLNAPKGLAMVGGTLYAADIDLVVSIDAASAKVVRRAPVPGALSLGGLAAGKDGSLYASDTLANKVLRLAPDGAVSEVAAGDWVEGPAGLALRGRRLYVAAWGLAAPDFSTKVAGRLYALDLKTKRRLDVTPVPLGNLSGVALESGWSWKDPSGWLAGDAWLVTDQKGGGLWRVSARSGEPQLLVEGLKKPAGLAYDRKRQWAVVALSGEDSVAAWDLTRFSR